MVGYCQETLPNDGAEYNSIIKYGGFYIGRYEAGDKEATQNMEMRAEENSNHNVSIKKGQAPYNFVTLEDATKLSEEFGSKNSYDSSFTTKLCSSYAWDTALEFSGIDKYNTRGNGNYVNATFNYATLDQSESKKTKKAGESILVPTGQTEALKKIYDMAGNLFEITSETFFGGANTFTRRGGGYTHWPDLTAGFRGYGFFGVIGVGLRI